MTFIVAGTNYKHSPIAIRERISFSKRSAAWALSFLKSAGLFSGAVILSTCNRVEIYAVTDEEARGAGAIRNFFSCYHEIDRKKISPYLYNYAGKDAIGHLFSVAGGLDSLVLGETEIIGQVRSALLESEKMGFAGENLSEIFRIAISFARKVRLETKISRGKVSVGSVALDFIKKRMGRLTGKRVLIVGTGKVAELVLKHLKKEMPDVLFVSNRTFDRAKELAALAGGKAVRFDRLKHFINKAHIIITATRSRQFIIKKETLSGMPGAHNLLIIDLAVPRDVDPAVREFGNVELFCLEDLKGVIERNIAGKLGEAVKAGEILEKERDKAWEKISELAQEEALLR